MKAVEFVFYGFTKLAWSCFNALRNETPNNFGGRRDYLFLDFVLQPTRMIESKHLEYLTARFVGGQSGAWGSVEKKNDYLYKLDETKKTMVAK